MVLRVPKNGKKGKLNVDNFEDHMFITYGSQKEAAASQVISINNNANGAVSQTAYEEYLTQD